MERIALVIERLTGVRHHPGQVWALLRHRLGWSVQRPMRRAAERDQGAIDRWGKEDWPAIKQTPSGAEPVWSSSTSPRSAFLGGEKATLLWDSLPAHRSTAMRAWIRTQRSWLVGLNACPRTRPT